MTAQTSALGALRYTLESTFCDTTQTSFGTRLAITERLDLSGLKQARIAPGRVVQRYQEETPHYRGPKSGEVTTTHYLTGHGSSLAGAGPHALSDLAVLLGIVLGTAVMTHTASTTATGGTATVPTTALASGFGVGGLAFFGAQGDGRGNGQASVIGAHSASSMTLLFALDAAMSNGDVIRVAETISVLENPTAGNAAQPTIRMEYLTANDHVRMWGCYPKAIAITIPHSAAPTVTITWGVADWSWTSATFPTTTTMQTYTPAPVAGGSFVKAAVGATTRTKFNIREFNLNITLGIIEQMGPGGGQFQPVIGCRRGPAVIEFDYVVDADTTTATPTEVTAFENDALDEHALYTWSAADGKAGCFYTPSAIRIGDAPTQFDMGGVNCRRSRFRARTGATTTSDLTQSAMRIGLG